MSSRAATEGLKVSLFQLDCSDEVSKSERVAQAKQFVKDNANSDLILLPELWEYGAFSKLKENITSLDEFVGNWKTILNEIQEANPIVIPGSRWCSNDGKIENIAPIISAKKGLIGQHSKMHLFSYDSEEKNIAQPGKQLSILDIGKVRLSINICYDLRFPELFRIQAREGVTIHIIIASWPLVRISHWKRLLVARAIENQAFVLACNAVGKQSQVVLGGNSCLINPQGEIVNELDTSSSSLTVSIDVEEALKLRSHFPTLLDSRSREEWANWGMTFIQK